MILIQWTLVDAESYSLNWIVVFCKKRSKMRTKFAFTVHHSLRHDAKLYLLLQKKLFLQQGNNAVGDRALGVAGPCVCNSVAPDITTSPSLTCFKQRLKTLLFQCAFHCNVWLCYTNIFFTVKCSQGFFDLWHYSYSFLIIVIIIHALKTVIAKTTAIDGLVSLWSENISVSFCQQASGYGLTLWCALDLLVGGAIQSASVPVTNLAVELRRSFLERTDQRLSLRLRLVNEQQQMQFQVAAEDLLSRLLSELHHHRQTVLCHERTQGLVSDAIALELGSTFVKLQTSNISTWTVSQLSSVILKLFCSKQRMV